MMYLLHGENSVASRLRLLELRAVEFDLRQSVPQITSLFTQNNVFAIWEDKKLNVSQIKDLQNKFPELKIEEFKIDPIVFKFLESLYPGNQQQMLRLWQKYLLQEVPEVAFTMIIRQFRLMLDPTQPEFQGWQQTRIKTQSARFSPEKLKSIYKELLEADYKIKSGKTVINLQTTIELILLSL